MAPLWLDSSRRGAAGRNPSLRASRFFGGDLDPGRRDLQRQARRSIGEGVLADFDLLDGRVRIELRLPRAAIGRQEVAIDQDVAVGWFRLAVEDVDRELDRLR